MSSFAEIVDPLTRTDWTVDEFLDWAMHQPGPERYELDAGRIVRMSSERLGHARVKGAFYEILGRSVRSAQLQCEALPDGVGVPVSDHTMYIPDALVRCGAPLDDDATRIPDPVIVVEVASPSTQSVDAGEKLEGYFGLPSLRHYLLARTATRAVIHHQRTDDGSIRTSIVREGKLDLDPPGIVIDLDQAWSVLRVH